MGVSISKLPYSTLVKELLLKINNGQSEIYAAFESAKELL